MKEGQKPGKEEGQKGEMKGRIGYIHTCYTFSAMFVRFSHFFPIQFRLHLAQKYVYHTSVCIAEHVHFPGNLCLSVLV